VCYDNVSKADLFNKHFASISSVPDEVLSKPLPPFNYITNLRIPPLTIEPFAVHRDLIGLNSRKSNGFDNLPNQLLKSCSMSLATPFSLLFKFILATNRYKRSWKIASVIPLHISGPTYGISNYRPITILHSVSKVFQMFALFKVLVKSPQDGGANNNLVDIISALTFLLFLLIKSK